jgi:hypothetical protein
MTRVGTAVPSGVVKPPYPGWIRWTISVLTSPTTLKDAVVRWRWLGFSLVGLMLLAAFNGQWRIGRDSAAFRGIARNLVRSHSYVFLPKLDPSSRRGDKQDTVYPGLPVVLALVDRFCGEHDLPPLLLMYGFSVGTLMLVYYLLRMTLPAWIAVTVTFCLGMNRIFVEQSNELLSDLPFLFGLMLALFGLEKLHQAQRGRDWMNAAIASGAGLLLAAVMRPTFWILAVAWIISCLSEIIWPRRSDRTGWQKRLPPLIALGLLAGFGLLVIALDPRTHGASFLSGGYEQRVRQQLSDLPRLLATAWQRSGKTVEEHIPVCFFAFAVKANSSLAAKIVIVCYSIMVIGAGVALIRINRMWGILVLVSFGVLSILGDVPRYYLMILSLLLAGWCVFCAAVAKWLGPQRALPRPGRMNLLHWIFGWLPQWRAMPNLAMMWGLGLVLVPNFIRTLDLVREQRGFDRKLHYRTFEQTYEDGKMAPLVRIAEMIKVASPKARIIGPEPTIVAYLSDRQVFGLERFTGRYNRGWRTTLAKVNFILAVFPLHEAKILYGDHDPFLCHLFDEHALIPTDELARTPDGAICRFTIRALPGEHVSGSRGARHRRRFRSSVTTNVNVGGPTTR